MNAKILVAVVGGLVFLVTAGYLLLGGGSEQGEMTPAAGQLALQETIDDSSQSAYDLPESFEVDPAEIEIEPRDLQARRGEGRGGGRDRFGDFEQRIMQFDADGDGMLNEAERDAMAESFRQRMVDRFDMDGDGMVSIEEQFAARRDGMLNSRWGQRMRNQFDADGDGELNEEELAAFNAELDRREQERMNEILSEYDTDGDGEMSVGETLAMQDQQFAEQRARMDQFAVQFDQDGDGNLNADERVAARDTMIDRRELEGFLRRYDTNKDGSIGTSDTERFTDAYGKKEPYADVNRDGVYNMDDVTMFRDMTERVNAQDD